MKPRVSVIIPTYNSAVYVGEALRSAINQTEDSVEIIVCDDCSIDGTVNIIRKFCESDRRVFLLENSENLGPSFSRNRAIQRAKGDWLAFLDSDDYFDVHRLERMIDIATQFRFDMIADNVCLVDKDGWVENASGFSFPEGDDPLRISATTFLQNEVATRSTMSWGFMKPIIRRRFLCDLGIFFDETTRIGEDFLLLFECLLMGAKMGVTKESLYYYRYVPGSLSRSLSRTKGHKNLIEMRGNNNKLIRKAQKINRSNIVKLLEKRDRIFRDVILYSEVVRNIRIRRRVTALIVMFRHPRSWLFCARMVTRYVGRIVRR